MDKKALLEWYLEAGVDEAVGDESINRTQDAGFKVQEASKAVSQKPDFTAQFEPRTPNPLVHAPSVAVAAARALADRCKTLAELEAAVRAFDGCSLKKTAGKTVFADGAPHAKLMVIGEAPGAQEDRMGIPFCGPSGALLDKMFAAIGLTRADALYISNTVFWRPPGNRQPSVEETAVCLPFVEKHIALLSPRLLVLSGGTAVATLMKKDQSISRLRGKIYEYTNTYVKSTIPAILMYHPSYLLRSPAQKRLAWGDLLMAQEFLNKY